jgi:hypothetical protein
MAEVQMPRRRRCEASAINLIHGKQITIKSQRHKVFFSWCVSVKTICRDLP